MLFTKSGGSLVVLKTVVSGLRSCGGRRMPTSGICGVGSRPTMGVLSAPITPQFACLGRDCATGSARRWDHSADRVLGDHKTVRLSADALI